MRFSGRAAPLGFLPLCPGLPVASQPRSLASARHPTLLPARRAGGCASRPRPGVSLASTPLVFIGPSRCLFREPSSFTRVARRPNGSLLSFLPLSLLVSPSSFYVPDKRKAAGLCVRDVRFQFVPGLFIFFTVFYGYSIFFRVFSMNKIFIF